MHEYDLIFHDDRNLPSAFVNNPNCAQIVEEWQRDPNSVQFGASPGDAIRLTFSESTQHGYTTGTAQYGALVIVRQQELPQKAKQYRGQTEPQQIYLERKARPCKWRCAMVPCPMELGYGDKSEAFHFPDVLTAMNSQLDVVITRMELVGHTIPGSHLNTIARLAPPHRPVLLGIPRSLPIPTYEVRRKDDLIRSLHQLMLLFATRDIQS